jgi:glycosyltransferase involved in cell wall biosynthesis
MSKSSLDHQPKVSVLMPVYNGKLYLREAIDSILNQTFSDFELLIIDDGSSDGSQEIIKSYTDSRVKPIFNPINQGLMIVLNQGNALAQGEYIARMDCDDISLPQRLTKQVEYLDQHTDVAVVGAQCIYIDAQGKKFPHQNLFRCPKEQSSMRWTASYECPFVHPVVMYRKQIVWEKLGGYDEKISFAEDFELWLRLLSNNYQGGNLDQILIKYRIHPKSMMNATNMAMKHSTTSPMKKQYLDELFPGYDREKEIVINFFNTLDPLLALETSQAMDTLRNQYVSIYLNGKATRDLEISMAREWSCLGYSLFQVDRWQATKLMLKAIFQYPGLLRESPPDKIFFMLLFGASGRDFFRSVLMKDRQQSNKK